MAFTVKWHLQLNGIYSQVALTAKDIYSQVAVTAKWHLQSSGTYS